MTKRRVPFNDADYLNSLSPSEREWYRSFIAEHYFGRRPKNRSSSILNQDQQRKAWREQHRERRDASWRAIHADVSFLSFDPSEGLTDLCDLRREARKVPWDGREVIFYRGVLMPSDKEIQEKSLEMIDVAIECVSDTKIVVKDANAKFQRLAECWGWLQALRSNLMDEIKRREVKPEVF